MKKILKFLKKTIIIVLVIVFTLLICVFINKYLNERNFDIKKNLIKAQFDDFVKGAKFLYNADLSRLNEADYPQVIIDLEPEEIRVANGRIYFVFRRYWVEEDGVFVEIERPDEKNNEQKTEKIKNNVYSYFDR